MPANFAIPSAILNSMKNTQGKTLVDLVSPGVEVVTFEDGGVLVSEIHGGALDGQRFTSRGSPDRETLHYRTKMLARMREWKPAERWRQQVISLRRT